MTTVYEAAGGAEGLMRLADAWHARALADVGLARDDRLRQVLVTPAGRGGQET